MDESVEYLRDALETGLHQSKWADFESWADEESDYSYESDVENDRLFDHSVVYAIAASIDDRHFTLTGNALPIVYFIEHEWGRFRWEHKKVLLAAMLTSYPMIQDEPAQLIIMGLLGKFDPDDWSLVRILEICNTTQTSGRALSCIGLLWIVRNAGTARAKERALRKLQELTADPATEVRVEATIALGKIASLPA